MHNRENAAAATAAARAAGVPDAAIARALRSFRGVEHRIEEVASVAQVRYVNDSKATNAKAALRAIEALRPATLHVILGGRGKKEEYSELAAAFRTGDRAYLIGEAAAELAPALSAAGVQYVEARDLETAVARAAEAASPGEIVLLSPACASFDQFRDFEARGEAFKKLVEELS
jgi:UDP-N-acetylmuramoylalanine--D-glutamate ligase